MKLLGSLVLTGALVALGCGDDESNTGADAAANADATTTPTADANTGGTDAPMATTDAMIGGADAMIGGADAAPPGGVAVTVYAFDRAFKTCLVRKPDRTLWCNEGGTVAQIGSDTDWASVYANVTRCAIKTNGTLWCWGQNSQGQAGIGDSGVSDVTAPTQVGSGTDWAQVSGISAGTCGIKTGGTLWCWGDGLGDAPVQMGSATNWTVVGGNVNTIRMLASDGTLHEVIYQVGGPTPVQQVETATDWASLGSGGIGQCMSKTNNELWCVADATDRTPNRQGDTADYAAGVMASYVKTYGLKTDGTLWEILNVGGGLINAFAPGSGVWRDLRTDGGGLSSCAINAAGELWCWGSNQDASMGTSAPTFSTVPTEFTLP